MAVGTGVVRRNTITLVIAAIGYKLALDIIFTQYVFPTYSQIPTYATFSGADLCKLVAGYLISGACAGGLLLLRPSARISRFVIATQLIFIVIPFLTVFGAVDMPTSFLAPIMVGYWTLIIWNIAIPNIRLRDLSFRSSQIGFLIVVLIITYTLFELIGAGGLRHFNLNFNNVYDTRQLLVDMIPAVVIHLMSYVGYVLNITLLILVVCPRSLHHRLVKFMGTLLVCCLEIFFFGMANFKAFLFVPVVVVGILIVSRRHDIVTSIVVLAPVAALMLLLAAITAPTTLWLSIMKRALFMPAAMHGLYFDYFSSHPPMLFTSHTFGTLFGTYSGGKGPVQVIAKFYFGRQFSPNVGWVGDAFARFGLFGVALFGSALAALLRFGDSLIDVRLPRGVGEALMFGPSFALASSGLFTVSVHQGLILALAVLWLMNAHYAGPGTDGTRGRERLRESIEDAQVRTDLGTRQSVVRMHGRKVGPISQNGGAM